MRVSIRNLKNGLSGYVRRVRAGGRIIVTDRGRAVAEVRPIGRERLSPAERLTRLEEAGETTRPSGRRLEEIKPLRVVGRSVAETILEDRR